MFTVLEDNVVEVKYESSTHRVVRSHTHETVEVKLEPTQENYNKALAHNEAALFNNTGSVHIKTVQPTMPCLWLKLSITPITDRSTMLFKTGYEPVELVADGGSVMEAYEEIKKGLREKK